MRTLIILLIVIFGLIILAWVHVLYTGKLHTDMEHPPVTDTISYTPQIMIRP